MKLLIAIFIVGCAQVPIHDEVFYGTKGNNGAVAVHTLFPGTQDISEADWLNIFYSEPLICESVSTFGDIKAAVEKLCSVCNCCAYDTQKQMQTFFDNIQKATAK